MQSAGGFIIDDLSTVFADQGVGRPVPPSKDTNDDQVPDSVATPKPLTSKQEAKLRSFLDGALEQITRGYRKRFDPSSPLHTLSSYLAEWMRLLGVLAHVPPYGSGSTNLLISYLLRCSTDLADGITGYSLAMEAEASRRQRKHQKEDQAKADGRKATERDEGDDDNADSDSDSDEEEEEERQYLIASRTKQLNLALQTLDLVDRIWAAVLRGNLINLPVALSNARKAFPDSDAAAAAAESDLNGPTRSHQPYHPRTVHSTSSLVPSPAIDGRFAFNPSVSTSTSPRENLPIHGSRGNRTVGMTDQVRLRNIAISSREKLFSWMRTELDAPAPPIMDEHDPEQEPQDNTVEGVLEIKQDPDAIAGAAEEGDDPDFEDVDIGDGQSKEEGYDVENDTEEHKHYQDLFERKLDPDEDDEDDEEAPAQAPHGGDVRGSDQKLGTSVLGTVEAVKSHDTHVSHDKRKREAEEEPEEQPEVNEPRADGLPSKRPRPIDSDAEQADGKMSRSEMGSINFNLADAIGQWDISFTRLFSRTLRTLSDLSEFTKRTERPDFASSLAGISGADEHETADDRQ